MFPSQSPVLVKVSCFFDSFKFKRCLSEIASSNFHGTRMGAGIEIMTMFFSRGQGSKK